METSTDNLTKALEELAGFLHRVGDSHWSKWIEDDLRFVRNGDEYGARRFLSYFGGMSSLNDLWLCRENGHAIDSNSVEEVNQQLDALRHRAWLLARELVGAAE